MEEMKCTNCGAVYDPKETKCPFCGYINPSGAESKFIMDLESNRSKLNAVVDDIKSSCSDTAKMSIKHVIKVIIITLLIILSLVGGYLLLTKNNDKLNYIDEIAWEHEHFEDYNNLFINEEYEKLMELLSNDGEKHEVWNWEHYDEFMEIAENLWK